MPGTTVTVSPRRSIDDLERLVRARVARDGVVSVKAKTSDRRQVRHLKRLLGRFADDDTVTVGFASWPDGSTQLLVSEPSALVHGWTGELLRGQ